MTNGSEQAAEDAPAFKKVVDYFLRTPPKPHEDMKLGKGKPKRPASPARKSAKKKVAKS